MKPTAYFSILFILLFSFVSCSENKEIYDPTDTDGFDFKIIDNEAYLQNVNEIKSDELFIPSTVTLDNREYPVVGLLNNSLSNLSGTLTTIHIPPSVRMIESNVFIFQKIQKLYIEDLSAWCGIDFEETFSGEGNTSFWESYSNPIQEYTEFYLNEEKIDCLVIPFSVEEIKPRAFRNLNISKLILSEKTKVIGESTFKDCKNLRDVSLGEDLAIIGKYAFSGCPEIEEIIFNNSLRIIEDFAFEDCHFQEISLPPSLEKLGQRAFYNSEFTKVYLPENLKTIGAGNFMNLSDLYFSGLENFMNIDFYNYEDSWESAPVFGRDHNIYDSDVLISDLIIPESITTIKPFTFSHSTINSIQFPQNLETIGENAFGYCEQLKSVSFPEKVKVIQGFTGCGNLENIEINEGAEEIGAYAFNYCTGLKEIIVPEGVKNISYGAFNNCTSLESISFPASLKEYNCTLNDCEKLKSIIMKAEEVPDHNKNIEGLYKPIYESCLLFVPEESINLYANSVLWGWFFDNIKPIE